VAPLVLQPSYWAPDGMFHQVIYHSNEAKERGWCPAHGRTQWLFEEVVMPLFDGLSVLDLPNSEPTRLNQPDEHPQPQLWSGKERLAWFRRDFLVPLLTVPNAVCLPGQSSLAPPAPPKH
jgi:hypothetical protein